MTHAEAVELAERAIRLGSCSAHKLATEGCATCQAGEDALAHLRGFLPMIESYKRILAARDAECEMMRAEIARRR